MPQISPGLTSLLNFEPSGDRAVAEIARTPALRAEAERVLPALKDVATRPAGLEGVRRVIGSRRVLFPQPERTPAESAAWWADYLDALEHLPEGAIEAAMQAWVKLPEAEFMPKPGKLLELAKTTPNRSIRAYERAKAAVEFKPEPTHERLSPDKIAEMVAPLANRPRVEPSAADKERVRQQMREYIAADDAKKLAKKSASCDMKSTAGTTDETGITPQMRAIIEARNAAQSGPNT